MLETGKVEFPQERRSPMATKVLGVYMPLGFFLVLMALFTFGYHWMPVAPWVIAIVGIDIAVIGAWPPRKDSGHNGWDFFPMLSLLIAISMGITLGLLNFTNMEPWVHAAYLREYSDVLPNQADPKAHSDAGIIHFAEGSTLATESSAGFRVWPHTYCAAPILGEASSTESIPPVGFWAVGINCCDSREKFWCDGAADPEARSGLRVEGNAMLAAAGHEVSDHFMQAVKMAAAANDLEAASEPIIVVWSRDPEGAANLWWWIAVTFFIVCTSFAALAAFACHKMLSWQLRMVKTPPR